MTNTVTNDDLDDSIENLNKCQNLNSSQEQKYVHNIDQDSNHNSQEANDTSFNGNLSVELDPNRSASKSPSPRISLDVIKQAANSKHSPGLAKRIQNTANNDDNQENNLDFHLEKNLKNLNLSATTSPNNNSNQTKTRKMREMTPDSIDDDSQPNSITTSLNENIQGYGVFTSPTQSLSNMSQNPMSMPVNLPMHQAYGLPINSIPPIQFLLPPSVLQQSPQQLTFQQQQQQQQFIYQQHQLAYQQQQYLMQIQQQAQFIQQQQQQQQQLHPIQESPSKTIQFLTDEDESSLNQLSNIKVKRIPNQLKNLRQTKSGSKATNRLAFAKSIVEDEDHEEFEADRGCEQVHDDQSQSSSMMPKLEEGLSDGEEKSESNIKSDFIFNSQKNTLHEPTRENKKSLEKVKSNEHQNVSKSSSVHSLESNSSPSSISPTVRQTSKIQNDNDKDYDTDEETNKLLDSKQVGSNDTQQKAHNKNKLKEEKKPKNKEGIWQDLVLGAQERLHELQEKLNQELGPRCPRRRKTATKEVLNFWGFFGLLKKKQE